MRTLLVLCCALASVDRAAASSLAPASRRQPSLLRFRGGATTPPSAQLVSKRPAALHVAAASCPTIPTEVKLLLGSAGIFLSFSVFAVLQEDVYKKAYGGEFFAATFLALLIERGVNALTAFAGMTALGKSGLNIPHKDIFQSGVSQMLAMAASNEALRFVSYPTQVLGKSCKMVPVMAGGIVLGGKRYSAFEYAQVAAITLGVCIFNFGGGKKKVGKKDSPYGLFLIVVSLLMDAFTGGLQDKVKASTKALNPNFDGPKRCVLSRSLRAARRIAASQRSAAPRRPFPRAAHSHAPPIPTRRLFPRAACSHALPTRASGPRCTSRCSGPTSPAASLLSSSLFSRAISSTAASSASRTHRSARTPHWLTRGQAHAQDEVA